MGYLSCNAESAVSTCDSYNFSKKSLSNPHNKMFQIRNFCYTDLESATKSFSHNNFLGKGSHGSLYRAVLDGGELIAAVKRTTTHTYNNNNNNNNNNATRPHYTTPTISTPADNEIETLSRVRSPRLVNLLGFASDPVDGRKLIVVEYMPNGSLHDLLHKPGSKPISLSKRVRVAIQIAKAVHHLHTSNPPVIHRDIKSSNILFDGKWKARLGDFGLALRGHVEDVKVQCTPPAGTLGYLDPCYLAPGDLSTKSDVFSFGILLLELLSGRNAIDMRFSPPSVVDWAGPLIKSKGYCEIYNGRIETTSDEIVVSMLAVLAGRCVKSMPGKRPDMSEVVKCLVGASKRRVRVTTFEIWSGFGRVRRRVRVTPPVLDYETLVESPEMVKGLSRRTTVVKERSDGGGENSEMNVGRSKSIGCFDDIESEPLDGNRGKGVSVKGVMSRSKSTGELRGVQSRSGGIVLEMIRNPNVRELESSKLLVKFSLI